MQLSLTRALRRREWRAVARLATGWLLNHCVFVALLLLFVSYGCYFEEVFSEQVEEVSEEVTEEVTAVLNATTNATYNVTSSNPNPKPLTLALALALTLASALTLPLGTTSRATVRTT